MIKEIAEIIVKAAKDKELDGFSIYENYSGRGMYGKTTTGVNFPNKSSLLQAVAAASVMICYKTMIDESNVITLSDFIEELGKISQDNMAMDYIIY